MLVAICILISIGATLMLVPVVRLIAHQVGMVDHPDSERKLHRESVALGGGLAVYLSLVVAFVATIGIDRQFFDYSLGYISNNWYVLFFAAGAILLVGLIDDVWSLRGRQKLLLQCLIIVGLVGSGTVIQVVNLLGYDLHLGVFAYPVTVLWLLVAVNALNLIDGADGVATTAGAIICFGFGVVSLQSGVPFSAVVGFAIAGSLAGFLVFNRPPATIYLGDAGSMMIGLFVGVLAVWSSFKESTVLASAPIAILAIPLFDSTAAVLRRWLTGRSIYTTDRAHLHHLLQEKYGNGTMLLMVTALCATTTTVAVLSVRFSQPWVAVLGVVIVFSLLVMTRSFGHAECRMLVGRAFHFAQSLTTTPASSDLERHHHSEHLQGEAQWDTIWEPLVDFAKTHDFSKVTIDLNLAWLHEGYHANWQSLRLPDRAFQLSVCVPLFASQRSSQAQLQVGRLQVIAAANDPTIYHRIAELSDLLIDLGPEIDRIVTNLETRKRPETCIAEGVAVESDSVTTPNSEYDDGPPLSVGGRDSVR